MGFLASHTLAPTWNILAFVGFVLLTTTLWISSFQVADEIAQSSTSSSSSPVACELSFNAVTNNVYIDGVKWLKLGHACVRWNGEEVCPYGDEDDKTVGIFLPQDHYDEKITSTNGTDPLGPYDEVSNMITIHDDKNSNTTQWKAWYRSYRQDKTTLMFGQSFPQALNDTAYPGKSATDSGKGMATWFPSFTFVEQPQKMGVVELYGAMAGSEYHIRPISELQPRKQGGLESGPLALLSEQCVVILSAASAFMSSSQSYRSEWNEYGAGVMGSVTSIPKGHETSMILSSSPLQQGSPDGIRQAFHEWGRKLLTYYNTQRPSTGDETTKYLQFNTDNGAFYYYQTSAPNITYQDTIIAVKEYADSIGLPFRGWLADSWWYYQGKAKGVKEWRARPEIFPDGFAYVTNATKWSLVAHNRYWAADTVYAKANGGQYDFYIGDKGPAVPLETRFWNDLFQEAKQWGMTVYEQDWLDIEMERSDFLLQHVDTARTWLLQMGQAAQANGIPIQYCMSFPRHILQSLEVGQVTQARASDDYQPSAGPWNWDISISGMFTSALGIAPLKDNFWSSTAKQAHKYNTGDRERSPRLHAVISTYSTGTVSPGDSMEHLDVDLLMKSCTKEGRLLQPDLPAVATDETILQAAGILPTPTATKKPRRRHVWSTMTQLSGYAYTYMLAIDSPSFEVTESDLYPSSNNGFVIWELDVKFAPTTLPVQVPSSNQTNIHVYAAAPVMPNGFCFLGEADTKWTPVSQARFSKLLVSTTGFSIHIQGAPLEVVRLIVRTPANKFVRVACKIPASGATHFSSQDMSCAP